MENCLVTKLKGTVDNEFLPHYDSAAIRVLPHTENVGFNIVGQGITLKLAGNAEIWDTDNDVSLGKTTTLTSPTKYSHLAITPCNSECMLFISPKYNQEISFTLTSSYWSFDIEDVKYFAAYTVRIPNNILAEKNDNLYGNINSLNGRPIGKVSFKSDNLEGNISELLTNHPQKDELSEFFVEGDNLECTLGDWSAFTGLTSNFGFGTPKATGLFSSLASIASITRFYTYTIMPLITGSVEDYVAIAKLRGAGSLRIDNIKQYLPNITYNGVPISTNSDVADSAKTISWDASGNITWS